MKKNNQTNKIKPKQDAIFANVTRYTTDEERAQTQGISVDPKDLEHFMQLVRDGLIEAASGAEQAVQNNMALSVETAIRISRPVFNKTTGEVEELVLKKDVKGRVKAKKIPKSAAKK